MARTYTGVLFIGCDRWNPITEETLRYFAVHGTGEGVFDLPQVEVDMRGGELPREALQKYWDSVGYTEAFKDDIPDPVFLGQHEDDDRVWYFYGCLKPNDNVPAPLGASRDSSPAPPDYKPDDWYGLEALRMAGIIRLDWLIDFHGSSKEEDWYVDDAPTVEVSVEIEKGGDE